MWKRRLYMDYAAATPVRREALSAMRSAAKLVGNPSSLHQEGGASKQALEAARVAVARVLECTHDEVLFTGSGTESNNIAILGVARALLPARQPGSLHIVTTLIEHASVREPIRQLEALGARVTYLRPDGRGRITPQAVAEALTPSTVLVSIGWANSEIGTMQPIGSIARAIRAYEKSRPQAQRVVFHVDAGQAPVYASPVTSGLGADLMTLDAGKLYGPRGVAVLFVRSGVALAPLMYGGGQERGIRPGTEQVMLAAGCAAALRETEARRATELPRMREVRAAFIKVLEKEAPAAVVNGDSKGMPHIVNVSVKGIDAEYVVLRLDALGLAVSTKSACNEGEAASYVVAAIVGEADAWRASSAVRFSFGDETTEAQARKAAMLFSGVVKDLLNQGKVV